MSPPTLHVVFAGERGTSEDYAECLWRAALRRGIASALHSAASMAVPDLAAWARSERPVGTIAVFVVSTAGDGEMPRAMERLWRELRRKALREDELAGLSFAVLALGDSSYQKFNYAGKLLRNRLLGLGAEEVSELGLADDQDPQGPDTVAREWEAKLWEALAGLLSPSLPPDPRPRRFRVRKVGEGEASVEQSSVGAPDVRLTLSSNERVTAPDHFQDTRLLDFHSPGIAYSPGDVAILRPENLAETVALFAETLGWGEEELEARVTLEPSCGALLPAAWELGLPCRVREALEGQWDLEGVPRRSFPGRLAQEAAEGSLERERLEELAADYDEWLDYAVRPRKSLVEVLVDFGAVAKRLSLEVLFDLLPPIRPRQFSIASAAAHTPDRLQLLVAVVEYRTRMARPRRGLCSNWLKGLQAGRTLTAWIGPGTFKLPPPDAARILVGPGTGVAPLRALVQHSMATSASPPPTLLFFGCRGKDKDFYFAEEWAAAEAGSGGRFRVETAFSQEAGEEKVYVQQRLREAGAEVGRWLAEGAWAVVAGSAKQMPKDVRAALRDALEAHRPGEGDRLYDQMLRERRLQLEVWG